VDRRILIGGAVVGVVVIALVLSLGGKKANIQMTPGQEVSAGQLYAQALDSKKEGEILNAKQNYQTILSEHSDFSEIEKVQKELENLNMELIFSNTAVPGRTVMHKVQSGDTLGELAKNIARRSN
jgi:hypothetical protein